MTLENLASKLKDIVQHMQREFQKRDEQFTRLMNDMPKTSKGDGFDDDPESESKGSRSNFQPKIDTNLGSIKMKIPSFHGKSDPEAYLKWEKKG